MDGRIHYLNTDLDLASSDDLTLLAAAFKSRKVSPLHVTCGEDGLWYSILETDERFDGPDANIAAILDVVESLSPELTTIWSRCDRKEFNIGYDCGAEPWAFNQLLRNEILGRMAVAGTSLRLTLYPDRAEITEKSHESEPTTGPNSHGTSSPSPE